MPEYSEADALAAGHQIAQHYVVGFVSIGQENGPAKDTTDTTSLGSGTLVELNGVRGILTAAHVVETFSNRTEIGLVRFGVGMKSQSLRVQVKLLDWIAIGGEDSGESGPDIAFVHLPLDLHRSLAATNVFFSPQAHSAMMQQREAGYRQNQVRFAIGVLGAATEQVKELNGSYGARFRVFEAVGEIEDRFQDGDLDRFTFRISYAAGEEAPSSYGGMSGGSLWQVMDDVAPLHRALLGVLYREMDADERGHRLLLGHGPGTIYGRLCQQVIERWPPTISS